jgi:Holliday junction resolvase RusA-like endonuclease
VKTRPSPIVEFVVYGHPEPAGSKRHVGKGIIVDANKKARPWKNLVAQVAGDYMKDLPLLRDALAAEFVFYRRRPKGHYNTRGELKPSAPRYPTPKPDITKLTRGTEDALKGVVFVDDAQIVKVAHSKEYGEPERVEIHIWEID